MKITMPHSGWGERRAAAGARTRRRAALAVGSGREVQVGPGGRAAQAAQRRGAHVRQHQPAARQLARQQRVRQALQRRLRAPNGLACRAEAGTASGSGVVPVRVRTSPPSPGLPARIPLQRDRHAARHSSGGC